MNSLAASIAFFNKNKKKLKKWEIPEEVAVKGVTKVVSYFVIGLQIFSTNTFVFILASPM
jgi:hypothetical protein